MSEIWRAEKKKDFTIISNHHIRNKNLSLKAKGLLTLMLSLPDTWQFSVAGFAAICKDGICSVRSAIEELEREGYIQRDYSRDAKGQFINTEYFIREIPENTHERKSPMLDEPILEKPILEKPI